MDTAGARSPAVRVAIVTGASRGVGRAIVRRLAARGHTVVVNYFHDQAAAEATVDAILSDHGAAVTVRADVADELDVERLFAETITAFGGLDAVVHTVGGPVTAPPLAKADLGEFQALCRINTQAAFIVNREAARHVRKGGAIVNLSTTAERLAPPAYGLYTAAQSATNVITRALARELRERDITVNAVTLDLGMPCAPHQVTNVVTYLLSADGHRLTGQLLRLDDPRVARFNERRR
jgi:3-oxoacyl-[acyl-carrier protein] reductase